MSQSQISQSIFKMYDIRGIVGKTVDADVARSIGRAFGSEIRKQGGDSVVVARDGRLSGPELVGALSDGLRAAGVDVVDLGMVPTPVGYFAASVPLQLPSGERRVDSCMVVTGSHNPPDYNGFKMVLRGAAIYGDQIKSLYQRIVDEDFTQGEGTYTEYDISQVYLDRIVSDVKPVRPMKIVIDTGNGVAGGLAPKLFKALGCELVELFTEIDGNFPNHHPDPAHAGEPAGRHPCIEGNRRRDRLRVRWRRRPPGRRDERRPDHLSGSPVDAVRAGSAVAQQGRADHL